MVRVVLLCALFSLSLPATGQEWIEMTSTEDTVYSAKAGSFELTSNKGGESIAVLTGSIYDKRTKSYSYNRWYVTTSDCVRGMGKLVALTTSNAFNFETDFVAGGENAAAGVADTICALFAATVKVRDQKGL